MIPNINKPDNRNKIAIVVVGYNRQKSISRLLDSLIEANYPTNDIPLIISIDCSGDKELYRYVEEFEWPHGVKYVNIQTTRLGLKNHIFQCGELSKFFKAIVLLEDDLFVSPYFYEYVERTVEVYGEVDGVAEISLYKNESNGYAGLPFKNLSDGNDVFLMQDVSTWGQCWTEQMWTKFTQWRDTHTEVDIQGVDMPERIKKWERAWSKYYNAYVVATGRHIIYPDTSLTTNFSDAGEHGGTQNATVQVHLLQGRKKYNLLPIENLVSYDIYCNNEAIPAWVGMDPEDVCLDLYGIHGDSNKRYILSTRFLPYEVIDSFALHMRPLEMNIKYGIKGEGIFLYDTSRPDRSKNKNKMSAQVVQYFVNGIKDTYLIENSWYLIKEKIKRRIKI